MLDFARVSVCPRQESGLLFQVHRFFHFKKPWRVRFLSLCSIQADAGHDLAVNLARHNRHRCVELMSIWNVPHRSKDKPGQKGKGEDYHTKLWVDLDSLVQAPDPPVGTRVYIRWRREG